MKFSSLCASDFVYEKFSSTAFFNLLIYVSSIRRIFSLLFCVYHEDPFIALSHLKRILRKKFYIHGWWDDWIKFADALQKNEFRRHLHENMYIDWSMKFMEKERKKNETKKIKIAENQFAKKLFFYFSLNNAKIIELMLIIILSMSQNLLSYCCHHHQHHFHLIVLMYISSRSILVFHIHFIKRIPCWFLLCLMKKFCVEKSALFVTFLAAPDWKFVFLFVCLKKFEGNL